MLAGTLGWFLAGILGWLLRDAILGQASVGLVTGVMQWYVLRRRIPQAGWWIPFSGLGWGLGWALTLTFLPRDLGLLSGLLLGAVMGAAQWVVLRRVYRQAGWWIPASAVAWTLGLTGVLGFSLVGAVMGAASGLLLEFYERRR